MDRICPAPDFVICGALELRREFVCFFREIKPRIAVVSSDASFIVHAPSLQEQSTAGVQTTDSVCACPGMIVVLSTELKMPVMAFADVAGAELMLESLATALDIRSDGPPVVFIFIPRCIDQEGSWVTQQGAGSG